MTATITDNPKEFVAIANRYEKNTRIAQKKKEREEGELKYKTSSDKVREDVISDIMATVPTIKAVILDKSTMYDSKNYSYVGTAKKLLREVMKDPIVKSNESGVIVIFDYHNAIKDHKAEYFTIKIADKYGVKMKKPVRVKDSKKTPILQTADFPAGAIGFKHNNIDAKKDSERDFNTLKPVTKIKYIELKKPKK